MQTGELRFNFDKLEQMMAQAIQKARDEQYKNVSAALIGALPELIATLRNIVVSPDASANQRMRCVELLCMCWARVLRTGLREDRATVSREKFVAKKMRAQADKIEAAAKDKLAALEISKQRKKIARQLKRAEQAAAKQEN